MNAGSVSHCVFAYVVAVSTTVLSVYQVVSFSVSHDSVVRDSAVLCLIHSSVVPYGISVIGIAVSLRVGRCFQMSKPVGTSLPFHVVRGNDSFMLSCDWSRCEIIACWGDGAVSNCEGTMG